MPDDTRALRGRILRLARSQPYCVLCTHGQDQAYGSLVAFAFSEDLRFALFATPVATRKYRLLSEHGGVALVVDDRPEFPLDMMRVEAITATGTARRLDDPAEIAHGAQLLLARHPQLESFVTADSQALFKIEGLRFVYVTRFQEVHGWAPEP